LNDGSAVTISLKGPDLTLPSKYKRSLLQHRAGMP